MKGRWGVRVSRRVGVWVQADARFKGNSVWPSQREQMRVKETRRKTCTSKVGGGGGRIWYRALLECYWMLCCLRLLANLYLDKNSQHWKMTAQGLWPGWARLSGRSFVVFHFLSPLSPKEWGAFFLLGQFIGRIEKNLSEWKRELYKAKTEEWVELEEWSRWRQKGSEFSFTSCFFGHRMVWHCLIAGVIALQRGGVTTFPRLAYSLHQDEQKQPNLPSVLN